MPNRILRDGILTSPRVAKLNWAEETFYRRLHSVVDDFGRYYADRGLVRAACYPRLLNKVSDSDIEKWLTACVTAALVRVYPAEDGERYLMVLDFKQQVRATKSKFPQPPDICAADAKQVQADAHLDVSVFGVVSEDGGGNTKRGTRLPPDWSLDPEDRAYCQKTRPELNPDAVALNFRDHWATKAGKDGVKLNWRAAWQMWVRKEYAPRAPDKNAIPPVSTIWHESAQGIKARAHELGIKQDDLEQFPAFKARVMAADAIKQGATA